MRAGALGDVLLLRRAVASLRAAGDDVGLLAPSSSGSALVGPGPAEVDRLIPWDRAEVAALLTPAGVEPGPLADALSSFAVAVAMTRSGVLVDNLGKVVPRVVVRDPVPAAGSGHASDWLASAVTPLAPVVTGPLPASTASDEEHRRACALTAVLPSGFLAVHPGSGSAVKNWPADRFAMVVDMLARDRPWLLVQGLADERAAGALRGRPGAVVAQDLPPRVLGAVLARAGVFIGNDSGVSHLAAAWGARTVALFGPTDPDVWSPVGPSVRVVGSRSGVMEGIEVDQVLAVVDDLRPGA